MNIGDKTTVVIGYTLKDTEGQLFESTEEVGGVTYLHGQGLMIPKLEEVLEGKAEGESLTVNLSAEEAYGARDEKLVVKIPRTEFEDPDTLAIGEDIQVHDGQTGGIMSVVGISDDIITLDGNHPYSGRDVVFDISVQSIRETTQEDIDALHEHHHHDHEGCGCGHDHSEGNGGGCCGDSGESKKAEGGKDCCGSGGGCCGS